MHEVEDLLVDRELGDHEQRVGEQRLDHAAETALTVGPELFVHGGKPPVAGLIHDVEAHDEKVRGRDGGQHQAGGGSVTTGEQEQADDR